MERRIKSPKPSNDGQIIQLTLWSLLAIILAVALMAAIAALTISSILWNRQLGNATNVCNGCPGIIDIINTDNSSLSPIVNQSLNFNGECGIETFINVSNITITNVRELSKYIVGQDGCSEFTRPQDAYNQAILDGKGGVNGAVILIKPGSYDFTGSQFQVLQPGIIFTGLSRSSVYFTSSDTTSGIYINIPPNSLLPDSESTIIFQEISFGGLNDTNGFILNVSSGRTILDSCYCQNSNFRIYGGKQNFSFIVALNSIFYPLPPNDFITAEGPNVTITWKDVRLVNAGTGTQGGNVFNLLNGFASLNLFNVFMMFTSYDGLILGPVTLSTATNLVQITSSFIENQVLNTSNFAYFSKQSGSITYDIGGSKLYFNGPIFTQDTDSTQPGDTPGDIINILLFSCQIKTGNASISYDAAVSIISEVTIQITGCNFIVSNNDDIINIPTATAGDALNIILTSTTLTTQAPPSGHYITGPNPALANLRLAGSVSLNGATVANGVLVTTIPFLF